MGRFIKKIWSGDVYEAKEYTTGKQRGRGPKEKQTSEEMAEYNAMEARKKCARIINANFGEGDLFLTLTHRAEATAEDACRLLRNFINRLKRFRKKKGSDPLKYIYVTETGKKGRVHHHMIINDMDCTLKEISKVWGLGRVMISRLEPGGDYTGLAFYITKDNYREYGRRWNASRNLKKPKEKIIEVTKSRPLRVPKGYRMTEKREYYSENTGYTRYLKAIKEGGTDYGENRTEGFEHGEPD